MALLTVSDGIELALLSSLSYRTFALLQLQLSSLLIVRRLSQCT